MDGLLVVDKPVGPTSHDVVALLRRTLRESRVGHTGTLDPAASGVLPVVVGRATRLARFLSAGDKSYDAVIQLGVITDTYDAEGRPVATQTSGVPLPSSEALDAALDAFRGTFLQQPPLFSAKKIGGRRSYDVARAERRRRSHRPGLPGPPDSADLPDPQASLGDLLDRPAPATVTVHRLELVRLESDLVTLRITCSAGFYVRALAHDLGARLGLGAHLKALRRSASAGFTLANAIPFEVAARDRAAASAAVIPLVNVLSGLSSVVLTAEGLQRAIQGRDIGPSDVEQGSGPIFNTLQEKRYDPFFAIRLIDQQGELVGIAQPGKRPGLLHPSVVLR